MKILYGTKDISNYLLSYEKMIEFEKDRLIGNTPAAKVEIEIDNTTSAVNAPYNKIVSVYEGDKKIGTYRVYDKPENTDKKLKLIMYDNMMSFNKPYRTKIAYPCAVSEQLLEIERLAGVNINYQNLPQSLLNKEINWYDNTVNMRLFIGWIAECAGMNVFADENGNIVFRALSKIVKHTLGLNDLESYTLCDEINISHVEFNNGLKILEGGTAAQDTLYISSDNPYISKQSEIDHIYNLFNGLSFTSTTSVKVVEIPELVLGDIYAYGDYQWIAMSVKTIYHGGEYAVQEINGEFSSKEYQALSRQIGESTKIRMLTVEINRNSNEMKILAEEQKGLSESYAQLVLNTDMIQQTVERSSESIFLMETGRGNIFENCNQYIRKKSTETSLKFVADMPLGVNMQGLRNKDICMSVDISTKGAVPKSLNGRVGCKFSITYTDDTQDLFQLWFVPGVYYLALLRGQATNDINRRVWRHFHIQDKAIKYVSNLGIYADVNGDVISVGRPKVEYGTYPTGFEFDLQAVRDSVTTVKKNYTEIEQKTNSLSLKSVALEQEVTTVKGKTETLDKRLQSTEIKLTPTEIVNAVNEKVRADGKIVTTSTTLDKDGFHIKGKGLDVTNLKGKKVFDLDENGNIVVTDIMAKNGSFEGVITNKSGTATAQLFQGALTFSDSRYGDMILGNNGFSFSSGGSAYFTLTNQGSSNQTEFETQGDNPLVFAWRDGTSKNNIMRIAKSVGNGVLVYGATYYTTRTSVSIQGDVRGGSAGGLLVESADDITFHVGGDNTVATLYSSYMNISKPVTIWGDLNVTGSNKHKVMPTSNGYVGMEAVESPVPMFEDCGTGITDDKGSITIYFDPTWLEVTSTDNEYYLFLQTCGQGELWVSERNESYFKVQGTPRLKFMWNVKARQKGFEIERYKKVDMQQPLSKCMSIHEQTTSEINDKKEARIEAYKEVYDNILKERTEFK